jgi:hypothetical protein
MHRGKKNPWGPLLDALDSSGGEELTADELRADLASRGLVPGHLVASVREKVDSYVRSQAWRSQAAAKRETFLATTASRVGSWLTKSPVEIERGMLAALRGEWGAQAQAAFRERTDLTVEDKARILDDFEQLRRMEETAGDQGG